MNVGMYKNQLYTQNKQIMGIILMRGVSNLAMRVSKTQ